MENINTEKEKELWRLARKRVGFKRHLMIYVIINAFLWLLWYFKVNEEDNENGAPWPIFCTLGWGIGVAFNFMGAYVFPKSTAVEKEFEKLKEKDK